MLGVLMRWLNGEEFLGIGPGTEAGATDNIDLSARVGADREREGGGVEGLLGKGFTDPTEGGGEAVLKLVAAVKRQD